MAAQRKKPGPKPGAKRGPGRLPKTGAESVRPSAAAKADPLQNLIEAFKGFQPLTLLGIALAVAFLILQLFKGTRIDPWLPNFVTAAGAAYVFWYQQRRTGGLEEKVCKYGLLAVVVLFLWRDYYITDQLSRVHGLDSLFNN